MLNKYLDKNEYIKQQVNYAYDYNNKLLKNGEIESELEMLYRLKNELLNIYNTALKPSTIFKEFKGTPSSSSFNEAFNNPISDIEMLISHLNSLEFSSRAFYETSFLNSSYIENNLNTSIKDIESLEDAVKNYSKSNYSSFIENFSSNSSEYAGEHVAHVNTDSNSLVLPVKRISDNTKHFTPKVYDTNGVSGNSHVMARGLSATNFIGESDLRADISVVANSSAEESYECELFKISDEVYEMTNGYGFTYKEGVSWITDENMLYLKLRLEASELLLCNWININPYIPEVKDFYPAMIESITISDGESKIQRIESNSIFNKNVIVTFKEQKVKFIDIVIKQYRSYKTEVGHFYSLRLPGELSSIYGKVEKNNFNRVDYYKPSLNSLFMKYDPKSKKAYSMTQEEMFSGDAYTSNSTDLFAYPTSKSTNVFHGLELIDAHRFSIGIKSLNVAYYLFDSEGIYLSKPFVTNNKITSITLEATDYIPKAVDGYIIYELSLDGGDNWLELEPRGRAINKPCTIEINSYTPFGMRSENTLYIDRLLDVKSIIVRIKLGTNGTSTGDTCRVDGYRLDIKQEVDYAN